MRIIRVFPRRTKATPIDDMAFIGWPPLPEFLPEADEVHVSVCFTWDIGLARQLAEAWRQFYPVVRVGGPALGDPGGDFVSGMYLRPGYTITSRGCPNHCRFCLVPQREGKPRWTDPVPEGHIVLDNNLLACSEGHIERVLAMLARQKRAAVFSGGLEAKLFTYDRAFQFYKSARVKELWFAYDSPERWADTRKAMKRAAYWFPSHRKDGLEAKVRCYVLAGFPGDTPEAAEGRCRQVLREKALPFMMLWQPVQHVDYPRVWKLLKRKWQRPAAYADEVNR